MTRVNFKKTSKIRAISSNPPNPSLMLKWTILATLFFVLDSLAWARPVLETSENDANHINDAMGYLMRYGYMEEQSSRTSALIHPEAIQASLREFQRFAGLNETGVMDEETARLMRMPRCGVKDFVGHAAKARKKRFALQGSRWRVRNLTYRISTYPSRGSLARSDVDSEIARALAVWSQYTDLTFTSEKTGKVHIDIKFEEGRHGDGDPFDGQGGTLAHAFFPVFGGDAHFDDQEVWTKDSFIGTNLYQTAAHEFGHSLGLSHSDSKGALMAPFYRGFEEAIKLDTDDISGIQELYGEKQTRPVPATTEVSVRGVADEKDDEELCNDASIDAIVTLKDGDTYSFKGSQYWKLTEESIANGYPRSIGPEWGGLPNRIDAAFTWTNGKTYFFKGSQYWRFTNQNMDSGYPKDISKGFEGIPDNVDGAFVWTGNEKIYFFKGSKYYRFDPEKKPPVSTSYPKPVSNWEGIPSNIDDAIRYTNGYTYFFKGGQYWRFDDGAFKVDKADPDFPRPAGFWWFGCSSMSQGIVPKSPWGTSLPRNGLDSRGGWINNDNEDKNGEGGGGDGDDPDVGSGDQGSSTNIIFSIKRFFSGLRPGEIFPFTSKPKQQLWNAFAKRFKSLYSDDIPTN